MSKSGIASTAKMTAGADMVAFARRGDALAVPATPRGDQVLNQVIFVVALASVLGSGWVMASYAVSRF